MEKSKTINDMETKRCSKCGRELTLDHFWESKSGKFGRLSVCKDCFKSFYTKKSARKLPVNRISSEGNALSQFTPRELMRELASRGYVGELKFVQTIDIGSM